MNTFIGPISPSLAQCSSLQVFRAGSNDLYTLTKLQEISLHNNQLSGAINKAIVNLSNLIILELHANQLSGEIPQNIGLLSKLEQLQLQLHSNNLNGTFPPSLTKCTNLTTLFLRNNFFNGEISTLNFPKLQHLQALDLSNNTFSGNIPNTLCLSKSLRAIRLSYNQLISEVPPCMASLNSLTQISLSYNHLSNVVGALNTLKHCQNLGVLFLTRCFYDERIPNIDSDNLHTFKNLQILTLAGCKLKGQIPTWISKLKKLKVLNLSFNKLSGPIPAWGGQFETFGIGAFEGNTKLCGEVIHRSCGAVVINRPKPEEEIDGGSKSLWYYMQFPLGLGYFVGLVGGTVGNRL
ncbi:hypothetical protein SASPL_135682 [Salvia splendens]|uniref:Protein brassinosteroid insensitive 1 n=1 Tax=Salvia splendens TaxID=180675 RepID=A0A8X8X075_SALSN|nr:hypothetical protein SASPL_135682 [Salvia splendens]